MKILAVMLAVVTLYGCAGSVPGVSRQGHAGITEVTSTYNASSQEYTFHLTDGKERENVEFTINLNSGEATYKAQESSASAGQALRARVESAIAAEYGDAVDAGLIDSIMEAISAFR